MRKVAIYARVSTEHEAQLSALDNQVQYYDNLLKQHDDWELYDRYIDEGITGTSTKKRKNFMRMIEDAKAGCFDLIVTREVSRFARNTVDTLQETRKLKKIGVEVYFTEDNIWTMNDEDGELRLTIMATLAQNESKKTSLRVKAGQMVSFQKAVPYGNGNILGYDRVGREYVINPEQAETVRMIYELYLNGYGSKKLRFELERRGRKTATGLTRWSPANISRILRNPFYCGIIVYRKQYVPDYLEQKKINNHGEVEQIVVEGTHEPIITREMFDKVAKQLDSRSMTLKNLNRKTGISPPVDIWSKKLECSCGDHYNRKVWSKGKGGKKYSYQCHSQVLSGTVKTRLNKGLSIEGICPEPMIQEWKLRLMAQVIFDTLWSDKNVVLKIADSILDETIRNASIVDNSDEVLKYNKKKLKICEKMDRLLEMRLSDEISSEEYKRHRKDLEAQVADIDAILSKLDDEDEDSEEEIDKKIQGIKDALVCKFDFKRYEIPDSVIDAFVDKIKIQDGRYIWKMNFTKEEVKCLVEGTEKDPQLEMVGFPTEGDVSTGCNR